MNETHDSSAWTFTAYKRVGQKVKPVSGVFPEEARVLRQFPHNPLDSLPALTPNIPEFKPSERLSLERLHTLGIHNSKFLLPEEKRLFSHIMSLNDITLAFEERDRGTLRQDYFSDYIMATIPHAPWEYRNIPIPPGIRQKVIEMLKSKIEARVYEASQSSYRNRWFCVLKKNGSLRIVHDLQPLNKVSIRDAGLLPIIDDFVEPYAGCQCYTVFDLFWGFDARIVHPKSRDMTAFYTPLGLLRLTALPMGYTNSPAEFQNCMTFILQHEIPDTANIFIDDLPVKGPRTTYPDAEGKPERLPQNPGIRRFIWEHAQDVHRIMHRIKCAGATFAPKKAQICQPEVVIVGQKCTPQGRLPDEDRVGKILQWPLLSNVKEVRGFLGLCGTVRIWIRNYTQIARPLTHLTRKDIPFEWTEKCQTAFDTLKQLISSAPILRPIDYTSPLPVTLSVDTSYIAIGFILSQIDENGRRRPARYGSLPINDRESRYSQPKLELYGLYRALRHWRLYIIGICEFIVEVDAKYIKGMLNEPDLVPSNAINRWIQGILMFDFTLKHVPADQFRGPDALSRRIPLSDEKQAEPHDDQWLDDIALLMLIPLAFAISLDPMKPVSREGDFALEISLPSRLSPQETQLLQIEHFLKTLERPPFSSSNAERRFIKRATEFFINNNRMFKRNGNLRPQLVISDTSRRHSILLQAHENLGHKGEDAVYQLIRSRFFWPHLRSDVHFHISSCHECQIRNTRRMELPIQISTPSTLFEKIYVDIMFMPKSKGFICIVAAKDDLSGVTEVRPLRQVKAELLAKFFWEQIYCRYGAVGRVVTDNGKEVEAAFAILLHRMGIPQVRIAPYNKRANGVVERGHYILREAIVRSCEKDQFGQIRDWPDHVASAVFADRVTISSVTGYSPYYLLHGMDPILPFDLLESTFLVDGFHTGMTTTELLTLRTRQLEKREEDIEFASQYLKRARLKSSEQFHKKFAHRLQKTTYPSGSLVLVRNTRLEMTINQFKTQPRYLGPYEVVRQTDRGNYVLKELDGTEHATPYAAFRLISYISRRDPILRIVENTADPDNLDENTSPYLSNNKEQ